MDPADVVVVDHGADGSAYLAGAFGARAVCNVDNPGYGAGQNQGMALTTASYVLLVNPDAVVDPEGVAAGVALLDAESDVAAVQGVIRNRGTGKPERSQGVSLGPVHLLGRAFGVRRLLGLAAARRLARALPAVADHVERVPDRPAEVDSLAAAAPLVRRSAFEEVGGFDEGYFLYGEDLDLSRRLRRAGWRLVALPVPWAEHVSGASSAGWWERELVWWEGTLRYAALWWSSTQWAMAVAATVIRTIPMALARPKRACELADRLIRRPMTVRRNRARPASESLG